ncbi:hypothetical protein BDW75DRAFT_217759 [Aspergillus navahoensis]
MAQPKQSPDIVFCDDGGRPRIDKYQKEQRFRPNDEVYILGPGATTREGPFKVSAIKNGGYALSDTNGGTVRNGLTFKENELELADPFA